ncbi:MAG: hypothetical protein ACI308_03740 [Muribaculaceae bacterium]
MLYKFRIVSDEVDNFKLEILIDSDDSFMRLRNVILDSAGYDRDQLDLFYICDEDWTKRTEVTLMEMDTDSDEDVYLMEDTSLSELVEDEGQKMMFMFDVVNGRVFYMEMSEIITNKILHDPLCQRKVGKAPVQIMDVAAYDAKIDAATAAAAAAGETFTDIDDDAYYGEQGYDEEELSSYGIEGPEA